MVLVDTTVWIDFFANRQTKQVLRLVQLIEQKEDLCLCGVILTEILQGIKNSYERQQIETLMNTLLFLEMSKDIFILSAEIYRSLRSHGITIRKTIDCMIAAVAIEHEVKLLHNDRDFIPIQKYTRLIVEM